MVCQSISYIKSVIFILSVIIDCITSQSNKLKTKNKMNLEQSKEIVVDVKVKFTYTPKIQANLDTEIGQAPEGSSVEITNVLIGKTDITDELLEQGFDFDALAEDVLNEYELTL